MQTIVSENYREQLLSLHQSSVFGNLKDIPPEIKKIIENNNIQSILDFGCGKGFLVETLKTEFPLITTYGFDPTHKIYNSLPESNVDLIMSFDVLEHIEPENLDNVLVMLHNKCNKVMYHLIACHPAKRNLPDGRNAHLIVESPEWWREKFKFSGWKIIDEQTKHYIATPKKGKAIDVTKYFITVEKWDN